MAEQGFRISMEAVAARAGCSKQTLYAHFGSKQELLRSVIAEHQELATARLSPTPEAPREDEHASSPGPVQGRGIHPLHPLPMSPRKRNGASP